MLAEALVQHYINVMGMFSFCSIYQGSLLFNHNDLALYF